MARHHNEADDYGFRREPVRGSTYDRRGYSRETMSGRDYPGSRGRRDLNDYRYDQGSYSPSGYEEERYGARDFDSDFRGPDQAGSYDRGLGMGGFQDQRGIDLGDPYGRDIADSDADFGADRGGYEQGRYASERFGQDIMDARTEPWTVPGPHTGRGPRGYEPQTLANEQMRNEVSERLARHGMIDASGIEVRVEEGEVTLEGTVDSRRAKRLAENVAESVQSVRDVHNRLKIKQDPGGS